MKPLISPMAPDDAPEAARVHARAVHGIAHRDYPAEVLSAWAEIEPSPDWIAGIQSSMARAVHVVAVADVRIVGFGAVDLAGGELRACYVRPEATRRGVGTLIVGALEDLAREHGLAALHLDSPLTAKAF